MDSVLLPSRLWLNSLLGAVMAFLGVAIAHSEGVSPPMPVVVVILLLIVLLQIAGAQLRASFSFAWSLSDRGAQIDLTQLIVPLVGLALVANVFILLVRLYSPSALAWEALAALLFVLAAEVVPPLRLMQRGTGLWLVGVNAALLLTMAYGLAGGMGSLALIAIGIGLGCLAFTSQLLLEFSTYALDLERRPWAPLVRMGWRNGLAFHLAGLAVAYAVFGLLALATQRLQLMAPVLFSLPFAVLQLLLLRGLSRGAKPIWALLVASGYATLGIAAYALSVSYWMA